MIIICLLTESNSQIYSLFYTLKEYLFSDELDLHNHMLKRKKTGVEVACYLSRALPAGNMPSIVCSLRDLKAEESA